MPSKYIEREKPWGDIKALKNKLSDSVVNVRWLIANIPGINGRIRAKLTEELEEIELALLEYINRLERQLATEQKEPPTQKD